MTIENLIKAVPPPLKPTCAFEGPWEPIEAELRTALPKDYKDLVQVYGSGQFMNFLSIYDPAGPDRDVSLISEVSEVWSLFSRYHPHLPVYPQPGGLLVCGATDIGHYIFWLTRGLVDEWPIVVWDHDPTEETEVETFECDLTDFVAGLITGDILPKGFANDDDEPLGSPPLFEPTADR